MPKDFETLIGYDFNAYGFYKQKDYLYTEEAMTAWLDVHLLPAYREGRELMVTDSGDNAVLHIKGGKVLHAGGYDVEAFARGIERRLA